MNPRPEVRVPYAFLTTGLEVALEELVPDYWERVTSVFDLAPDGTLTKMPNPYAPEIWWDSPYE